MIKSIAPPLVLIFTLLVLTACMAQTELPAETSATIHRTLKLKVYRYHFESMPELSSKYSNADIDEAIARVNEIWEQAGITWLLDSVEDVTLADTMFPRLEANPERSVVKERLINISPAEHKKGVWNVVLIREFPVPAGGLYLPPSQTLYFAETARGGMTSPIILAHELGHSLGLAHDRGSSNLMHRAAGGRGTPQENADTLTSEQIATTQRQASLGPIESAYEPDAQPSQDRSRPQRYDSGDNGRRPAQMNDNDRKERIVNRLKGFDYDDDGVVKIDDVPTQGRRAFKMIDKNNDGKIDADEMETYTR